MSELFNALKIKAAFISSAGHLQKPEERQRIFDTFKNTNDIEVLCAVNILNEGADIPDVNIGIMARPTRSNIVYSQQIGRLSRSNEGKKKFFAVLDFVDNSTKDFIPYTAGTLLQKSYESSQIVTKYVENKDNILLMTQVESIMKKVEHFENELWYDIKISRKELLKENKYYLKFGKHSKGFLNEINKQKKIKKN